LQDRIKNEVLHSNSPLLARLQEPSSSPCYSPDNTFRFGRTLRDWKAGDPKKPSPPSRKKTKQSRKSDPLDVCCWDDSCECVQNGIRCHDSTSCGCLDSNKACDNPNGQYIYKEPRYPKKILQEWLKEYNDVPSDNESDTELSQSCSQENTLNSLSERLCSFVLDDN